MDGQSVFRVELLTVFEERSAGWCRELESAKLQALPSKGADESPNWLLYGMVNRCLICMISCRSTIKFIRRIKSLSLQKDASEPL